MDIAFHYFAVKTLACIAGFSEPDVQIIAKYSQFIDDYNWYSYLWLTNIPDSAKRPELDLFVDIPLVPQNFNPATTGFIDKIDYATLAMARPQKFTVSPFHFIPRDNARVAQGDLRTYPCTRGDGSYIADLLAAAQRDYRTGEKREQCLMHIGMLLHTFADTYAHQFFTGYHDLNNKVALNKVINNITGNDETQLYRARITNFLEILRKIFPDRVPAIGHMMIDTVPDLTHLSFEITDPMSPGTGRIYYRSNTQVFVDGACREILNYLRGCRGLGEIDAGKWNALSKILTKAFLFDISQLSGEAEAVLVKYLIKHWESYFPEYRYAYSSDDIKSGFYLTGVHGAEVDLSCPNNQDSPNFYDAMTDEFYQFNVFADELLIELYGNHPRRDWQVLAIKAT